MKIVLKIILAFVIILGLIFFYVIRYTYPKSGEDTRLYLNPFQPDQRYFDTNYKEAETALKHGDTLSARQFFRKALKFHGSYNERQRENVYSDANDLWEYKLDKLLKYSRAYELSGETEKAISCLAPGLISVEKWHFPIDKRFFELVLKKSGKNKTIALINNGLDKKIEKTDCYHCCSYYYLFENYKIGIDENERELAKTDRTKLIKDFCDKYGI